MSSVYFHDLPVYRLSREGYDAERDKEIGKRLAAEWGDTVPSPHDLKETREEITQRVDDAFGRWRFNEIVGYLRLYFSGSQVLGRYYGMETSGVRRTRTKTFISEGHKLAGEEDIPAGATSADILDAILRYVDYCRAELPKFHFDDVWLHEVGPYVDWRALLMKSGWRPGACCT